MDVEQEYMEDALSQDSYSRKDPETFKECVLRAIEKCRIEMSKEMTKGKTLFIEKDGASIPVVIPDQRKVVEGCINMFHDLMLFTFDNIVIEKLKEIREKITALDDEYLNYYLKHEKWQPHKKSAEDKGAIPQESSFGNMLLQGKDDDRVELFREMFQQLVLLYKRKNELKDKRIAQA